MQVTVLPAPDVIALRLSRVAVLQRLLVFARSLLAGLLRTDLGAWLRIGRWVRIILAMQAHIRDGALDEPRAPREARTADAAFDVEAALDRELRSFDREFEQLFDYERDDEARREQATVQSYLDRPFGKVVALICKGLGMTPDWDGWAAEPWALEEIRTRPPGSPYAGYAKDPLKGAPSLPPPERTPTAEPRVMEMAAPPGLPAPPPRPRE